MKTVNYGDRIMNEEGPACPKCGHVDVVNTNDIGPDYAELTDWICPKCYHMYTTYIVVKYEFFSMLERNWSGLK